MGLSRTISEIDGYFCQKLQVFPALLREFPLEKFQGELPQQGREVMISINTFALH